MLSLLKLEDQERLTLFMESPYFNTSPTLSLFWTQWKTKVLPLPPAQEVTEAEFVAGTDLKVRRIDALCWELSVKVREFLTVEGTKARSEIGTLLFTQSLLDRDAGMEVANRFLPDLERELEEKPDSPEKNLAQLIQQDILVQAKTAARRGGLDWYAEFSGLHTSLSHYFQVKSLQWSCGVVNVTKVFRQPDKQATIPFYAETLLAPLPEDEAPIPHLFRLCLLLLTGSSQEGILAKILSLLQQEGEQIAPPIRYEVYGYVLNHCIRHVNRGDQSYLQSIFEIYRLLYPLDQPAQDQQIHPLQLKNVVSIACRSGHLQWGLAFMKGYQPLLSELDRELALQFNTGVLAFHETRFKSAIQLFQSVIATPTQDAFYGLDARIYLWKSYYESRSGLSASEADEMYRLYDSFRVYVDRNRKVSASHQQQFRNLVRQFKRLMKCVEEPDAGKRKRALLRFQEKLLAADYVANITWLLQKVEEAMEQG